MAVLVAEILTNSKALADGPLAVADATWLVLINRSVESLWRFLTPLDPGLYFASGDFALTASAAGAQKDLSTVSAIAGFRTLHGVDLSPDTSNRRTVMRRAFQERNQLAVSWWTPAPLAGDLAYELRGRTLVITPYENAAGSYRAYATLAPYHFVSIVDTVGLDWQLEQYVEYIEVRAAMRALGIEESSTDELAAAFADIKQEISDAHSRDDAGFVIADVEDT